MDEFISRNIGSKEPGIILGSLDSLVAVSDVLAKDGFETISETSHLVECLKKGGRFVLYSDQLSKDLANFFDVIQSFSSGSVDVGDTHISPDYDALNVILVASPTFIEKELDQGRDWMALCGMSYQYPA